VNTVAIAMTQNLTFISLFESSRVPDLEQEVS